MSEMLIEKTSAMLVKVLDGASLRQAVLAENIANADTPGFTRKQLSFEENLYNISSRSDMNPDLQKAEIDQLALQVDEDVNAPRRADGNNVDIEREMTTLAKNSLQYDTAAQLLITQFRTLKLAIHEGRR